MADTTPPAVPTGVTATPGPGQVTLNWTANTEADLAGYRILRNGVQVASLGDVTSYVSSGLLSTQSYSFVVRAVDTTGNVSGDSATVSATPLPSTTTEQVSGSLKKNVTSVTYTRTAQAGALRGVASGSAKGRTASITLVLKNAQGQTIGSQTGTSVAGSATAAAAGAYSWTISGANGVAYSLAMTYVSG